MTDNDKGTTEQGVSRLGRASRFLTEVRAELSRVTWPARREVWATTIVVMIVASLFGVYLYAVDLGASAMVRWVFRQFGGA
jgi:preprotein translocase subunit SecE